MNDRPRRLDSWGKKLTVDGELTGGQGTNHEETGADAAEGATDTELLGNLEQARGGALTGETLGLVDLGQHGIGGLGDDGGSETGHQTGAEVTDSLHGVGQGLLGELAEDGLGDLLEDDELGHGVRDPRSWERSVKSGSVKTRHLHRGTKGR